MERPRDPDFAARFFGTRPEHALALLRAAWPAAVGPELARRTEVVALDRGVLRIKVPDAGWQKNLQRIRADLLSRLRRVAGGVSPYALGFVVGTVVPAPEPASPPAPAPAPGAPPSVPPALAEAARSIADPEIRARFEAAAALYFARFAGAQAAGSGEGPGSTSGSGSNAG
jgi:hypothetical protein